VTTNTSTEAVPGKSRYDVIYDGDCGICEATREYGTRLDWFGWFRWRANQDEAVAADHPQLKREDLERAVHVVGGGRTLAGFEAVRFLLLRWPMTCWLGALMHLPGVAIPGRWAYRWVADHRKTVLACRLGEPTIFHRIFASVFICAVLGVVAAGTVLRVESWPLTCVPMFANHVEPDGARYSFRFVAVDEKGKEREIPSDACGIPELRLKRVFFARYYGSVDPSYEYGALPGDTPAQFEERLTAFFALFAAEARNADALAPEARSIRLDAVREADGSVEKFRCGSYDIREERFRRTP
jgi:predicted DCC family thiol-disulfide oxidoreductase YuxK